MDLIGCEDADKIVATIEEFSAYGPPTRTEPCSCGGACSTAEGPTTVTPEVMVARPPERVEVDRAGYFVIIPDPKRRVILVEHYAYDNQLQHVLEASSSRDLYSTIIGSGWVSQLSHAAYLGKELTRAEL